MRRHVSIVLALVAATGIGCGIEASDDPSESQSQELSTLHRGIARGEFLFRFGFPGTEDNGRTCQTCHDPKDAFGLTPESAEARFQHLQRRRKSDPDADDPLFRSIDANDRKNDFTNLRQGLVRVTIKLPTDAKGNKLVWPLDDPSATEVSVWRSVPTVLNVAMTAPYQADTREPTLQSQALGALRSHSQIKHTPPPSMLDDVAAFEKAQFSSRGAKAVADAIASGKTPPDPDPPLTPFERRGKALFEHDCLPCHGGPSQTQVQEPLASLASIGDVFISKPVPSYAADLPFKDPPVRLAARQWAVRVPGETEPFLGVSTDPGKVLITGNVDHFNVFDIPTCLGISKTAPYFHDNSARTLTEVVRHYQLLFEAFRRIVPPEVPYPLRPDPINDADIAPLVAYLRKI